MEIDVANQIGRARLARMAIEDAEAADIVWLRVDVVRRLGEIAFTARARKALMTVESANKSGWC